MTLEICETCKWCEKSAMCCVKYPPKVFPLGIGEDGRLVTQSAYPPVARGMRCGEWQIAILHA